MRLEGIRRALSRVVGRIRRPEGLRRREELDPQESLRDSVNISDRATSEVNRARQATKVKMRLTEEDMREFERYAPIILIPSNEKYVPVKLNFDGNWNLVDNPRNYQRFREEIQARGLSEMEVYQRYAVAYVNKLEDVEVDGERYTVYQYWFYWVKNDFPLDWHDHDFEYVQVYVDRHGRVRRVYTRYHLFDEMRDYADGKLNTFQKLNRYVHIDRMLPSMPVKMFSHGEPQEPVVLDTHPVVYMEPGGHGMVQDPNKSLVLVLRALMGKRQFKMAFMPTRFIPMIDELHPDAPFPGGEDRRGLTDRKGNLKHRGFPHTWFMKCKAPIYRKSFWRGAHALDEE